MDNFFIPKTLDDPERFLWFTMDETMSIMVPLFVGILLGYFITSIFIAIICFVSLRKLKRGGHLNMITYAIYWHYPDLLLNLKHTPSSYIRNYKG